MDGVKEVDKQEALSRLEEALTRNCAMAVQNTAYDIWLTAPRGRLEASGPREPPLNGFLWSVVLLP